MAGIEQQEYSATGDGRECADEVVNDNVIGKEKTKDLVVDEKIGGGEGGWDWLVVAGRLCHFLEIL